MPNKSGSDVTTRFFRFAFALVVLVGTFGGSYSAASPPQISLLRQPPGRVVRVSTEAELQNAVRTLLSNTTIVIAPGTYELSSTLSLVGVNDVTLRGSTDRRDDVVLIGKGMTNASYENVPSAISTSGRRITIANLTVRDVFQHSIVFEAGAQAPHVYNVHMVDAGHQFIKANAESGGPGVDRGVVEYSVFEYTSMAPADDVGGIEVRTGAGWTIRHNLFVNILGPPGKLAGPAVLIWEGSRDAIVSNNTFVNCQREISMGLQERTPNDNAGGIVRNNVIYRPHGAAADVAILLADSPGTKVLHNTIVTNGTSGSPIEYRFRGTRRALIANNLLDGPIAARDGATAALFSNYLEAVSAMFVDSAGGNLHLVSTAAAAIDRAAVLDDARDDFDGDARPQGDGADIGADERIVTAEFPPNGGRRQAGTVVPTSPAAGAGMAQASPAASADVATLPSPWQSGDIGSPALAGSATLSDGTLTIVGSGADIWGTSDQFQFAYRPMTGDGEVIARVASLTNTNPWAKAGVMLRNTLSANSAHAFVAVTAANGVAFQRRRTTGGLSTHTTGGANAAPYWVRLVRAGSVFRAYSSSNGAVWKLIGSSTITMGSTVFAGLAVTSHAPSLRATAVSTSISVQGVVLSNSPPAVTARATFTPSSDSATNVTSYNLDIFGVGADPSTATPVGSQNLGNPPVVAGDMSADISLLFTSLSTGSYFATVTAIGPGGNAQSAPSAAFSR